MEVQMEETAIDLIFANQVYRQIEPSNWSSKDDDYLISTVAPASTS
jgi:hypothetical protein